MNNGDREPLLRRTADLLQYLIGIAIVGLTVMSFNAWQIARDNTVKMEAQNVIVQQQLDTVTKVIAPLMERLGKGGFNAQQGQDLTSRVNAVEEDMQGLQRSMIESLIELLEPRNTSFINEIGALHKRIQEWDRDEEQPYQP